MLDEKKASHAVKQVRAWGAALLLLLLLLLCCGASPSLPLLPPPMLRAPPSEPCRVLMCVCRP